MPINRFRGKNFFLSNFYPCQNFGVQYEGQIFPTSEHAYQAAKCEDPKGRDSFALGGSLGKNPLDAKRKGRNVKLRGGWSKLRTKVMLDVVRSKFNRDPTLAVKLIATGAQQLVEGHTGDKFWGGKRNRLGNILMKVRNELNQSKN